MAWAFLVEIFFFLNVMHQSIPAVPTPPPPPPLKKLGKFLGMGTHKLSKCPGVGMKKEGKCPTPGIVAFQHFLTSE